jgi:MFS family permease
VQPFRLGRPAFDQRFRRFLVALVLFTLGNSSDAFLLVRASEVGVSLPLLPLLWLVFHLAKSVGNFLAGRLVDRAGPRGPLLLGWFLYAALYVAFGLATAAWQIWVLFLLYAIFYSLTEPAEKAYVANLTGPERRGEAFGWFNFAIGVSALPSSLIFGWFYEAFGPVAAFGWGACLALLASALLIGEDLFAADPSSGAEESTRQQEND